MKPSSVSQEEKKKCCRCQKTKRIGLFSKGNHWCKACYKKKSLKYRTELKQVDFLKWKATQFRSNWVSRARKNGADITTVPSRDAIKEWLEQQSPLICSFTKEKLDREFGVDHIVPVARGGSYSLDNLCITSSFINGAKGAMTGDEFKQLLKLTSKWEDKGKGLLSRLRASNNMFGNKKGK